MKRGDIRVLGAASYATPLLSTAFLILAGFARPSATIAIAAILIAGGGLIAAKDMVWRKMSMVRLERTHHAACRRLMGIARLPTDCVLRGSQSFGASSNFANSNPGATVQPTSVQSPVLSAACHASAGTIACGRSPAARSGPSVTRALRAPSSAICRVSGLPA